MTRSSRSGFKSVNILTDPIPPDDTDDTFDEVNAINPHGFDPVNAETARVLKPGGKLKGTGQTQPPRPNAFATPKPARAGLSDPVTTPMLKEHDFGVQKTTGGKKLDTSRSTTSTYTKKKKTE